MGIIHKATHVTHIFRLPADSQLVEQFFDQCEKDFDPDIIFPVGRGQFCYVVVTTSQKITAFTVSPVATFHGEDSLYAIELVDSDCHLQQYGW